MFKNISQILFQNSEFITLAIILIINYFLLKFIFKKFNLKHFGISLITISYFILAVYNLGSFKLATSTFDPISDNGYIIYEANENFNEIYTISGEGDNNANDGKYQIYYNDIEVSVSKDNEEYALVKTLSEKDFYKYQKIELDDNYRYLKLYFPSNKSILTELYIANDGNQKDLRIKHLSDSYSIYDAAKTIDEQDSFTQDNTYMDETFFDEIYHVRNAYEIANNQKMYTAVHPLFGTEIIALGIKLFGMNPFGFRIMGVIFSTLMLPLIYLFIKEFTDNKFAIYGSLLFMADFMHYTTARIATLEPFSIFFIIAMYYFMIKAIKVNYVTHFKKHLIYLLFSAIFMAMAISTKWTGCYGAVGLALIYFIFNIKTFLKEKDNSSRNKYTIYLLLFSILFFVILPIIFYVATFIFVPMYSDRPNNFKEFIDQVIKYNTYMATYHFGLESTHPYSSKWYQWLFNIRPIWYYVKRMSDGIMTITCMNNPLINLMGVTTIIYSFYKIFKDKSLAYITLIIMYLSQLLPWVLVERTTFAYHYYPSIPFMILIISYSSYDIYRHLDIKKKDTFKKVAIILLATSIILFILFLPVISGFKTNYFYIQKILRWLPSWYFG